MDMIAKPLDKLVQPPKVTLAGQPEIDHDLVVGSASVGEPPEGKRQQFMLDPRDPACVGVAGRLTYPIAGIAGVCGNWRPPIKHWDIR